MLKNPLNTQASQTETKVLEKHNICSVNKTHPWAHWTPCRVKQINPNFAWASVTVRMLFKVAAVNFHQLIFWYFLNYYMAHSVFTNNWRKLKNQILTFCIYSFLIEDKEKRTTFLLVCVRLTWHHHNHDMIVHMMKSLWKFMTVVIKIHSINKVAFNAKSALFQRFLGVFVMTTWSLNKFILYLLFEVKKKSHDDTAFDGVIALTDI